MSPRSRYNSLAKPILQNALSMPNRKFASALQTHTNIDHVDKCIDLWPMPLLHAACKDTSFEWCTQMRFQIQHQMPPKKGIVRLIWFMWYSTMCCAFPQFAIPYSTTSHFAWKAPQIDWHHKWILMNYQMETNDKKKETGLSHSKPTSNVPFYHPNGNVCFYLLYILFAFDGSC